MISLLSTVQSLPDDDRAAVERALVPLARDAALGALGPDLGHDAGNALFGLLGLIDLLEPGEQLTAHRIDLLRQSGRGLDGVVRDVLEFVRTTRDDRAVSDLAGLARLAAGVYGHGGRTVTLDIPEEPVRVACPPGLTAQVALHLMLACGMRCTVELEDGALRVASPDEETLDEIVARRIALDHGGSLARDGGALVLRLPSA